MTVIKVCGITNIEDALLALELGVDALGFIFSESPRRVTVEKAREIIEALPNSVIKVGVFSNEPMEFVKEVSKRLSLDFLQFHGDEPPDYLNSFGGKGIKAFKVKDLSVLESIKRYNTKFFLLDSGEKGKPFDWDIALKAKELGNFLLGGGLNPQNIESALVKVSPFGVDVCSGVEKYEGKKDPLKLKDFVWRVKRWENSQGNSVSLEEDLSLKP